MKFVVDSALCNGHGQCYLLSPEVYSENDDGFNAAVGRTAAVPAGQEGAARAGALACPESAIQVLDDDRVL